MAQTSPSQTIISMPAFAKMQQRSHTYSMIQPAVALLSNHLKPKVTELLVFVLANDGESMPFRVENVNLPFQDVGNNTDLGTFVIGQYDLLDSPIIGLHDLGEILPPGLQSIEQVAEYLELARFAYESGAYGQFRVIFGYLPGDLNNDYTVDNLDIDLMRDAVINMTSDSKFNVDAQGHPNVPDSNDFDFYITDPSMLGDGLWRR